MQHLTRLDICSRALRLMGYAPLSSLSDKTESASLANLYYESVVQSCLANHPWNFASRQVKLVLNPIKPVFGFEYAFPLPQDILTIVRFDPPNMKYQALEGELYTNHQVVLMTYVFRIQERFFPPKFVDYVIACLVDKFLRAGMPDDSTISNITVPDIHKALGDAVYADARNASVDKPPIQSFHAYIDRGYV